MRSTTLLSMFDSVGAFGLISAPETAAGGPPSGDPQGVHDFDFFLGTWHVRHRRLNKRLAGCSEWSEFTGTSSVTTLMNGTANVDDNVLELPGGTYRAVSLRTYDPADGTWSIWWLDSRNPGHLDPPVRGRFDNGIGVFLTDDTWQGRPIKVRFTWSHITPRSCRWEQAFSADGGTTWETNWIMEFERVEPNHPSSE